VEPSKGGVSRRVVLVGGAGVVAAAATGGVLAERRSATRNEPHLAELGSAAPLVVSGRSVLHRSITVSSVLVERGASLEMDPQRSVTLTVRGNVVVRGLLRMAPARPSVQHRVSFPFVEESRFVGGGMTVMPHDTGIWVMGMGRLELAGSPKTAWLRVTGSLAVGTTRFVLRDDPVGWRIGDQLAITPTAPGSASGDGYDEVRIAAIDGRSVTLERPLEHHHPAVAVGAGRTATAEVLNLSRNVRIEGRPDGRTHVIIISKVAQRVGYTEIRHVGPRQADGRATRPVVGRYGLHFHMCGDGSRGSLVEGVVVRDAGSHAFVPHSSNGVRFRSCISHDTYEDAYWWDGRPMHGMPSPSSDDVRYSSCVASLVRADRGGHRLTGFSLGRGRGSRAVGCVAVGVQGGRDSSGFLWPEGGAGHWRFDRCVVHNCARHGVFLWQNTATMHVIDRLVAYHNGGFGISNGAYRNDVRFRSALLYGNAAGGVVMHAVPRLGRQSFDNLRIDGAGRAPYGVEVERHVQEGTRPVLVRGCVVKGHTEAGVAFTYDGRGTTNPDLIDLIACDIHDRELWLSDQLPLASRVRLQPSVGPALAVRPTGGAEPSAPEWNAMVVEIDRFAGSAPPVPPLPYLRAGAPAPTAS